MFDRGICGQSRVELALVLLQTLLVLLIDGRGRRPVKLVSMLLSQLSVLILLFVNLFLASLQNVLVDLEEILSRRDAFLHLLC